jgi:hypothetical protein
MFYSQPYEKQPGNVYILLSVSSFLSISARLKRMSTELIERLSVFEDTLKLWEIYEEEYTKAKLWLDTKELLSWEMLAKIGHSSGREEGLEAAKVCLGFFISVNFFYDKNFQFKLIIHKPG